MNLYRNESNNPKWNAQRNLAGRSHYVDDDTLRFHHSRVISAHAMTDGLLFLLVTSDALDMRNTKRGFRYSIFDVFGNVIDRPDLEHAFRTSKQATNAMWKAVNALDVQAVTLAGIERQERHHADEMTRLRADVAKIAQARAA